jgi:hypothetical protein
LSEIAKAQTEIQLSRQRQESLKEALNMADEHAAERVKHIVLQHPQVVDDPVYVTALRNLQVDGMLMAGASGTISGLLFVSMITQQYWSLAKSCASIRGNSIQAYIKKDN